MIPLKDQEYLRAKFAQTLVHPVKIEFFTQREMAIYVPGREPCPSCKPTQEIDRKSTRLNSSHIQKSRMPSSA